jgi:hypothetical protein
MLNSFIKEALSPVLIDAGFKAAGRVYRREVGDALQLVDIQNWKFNDSKRARFTIEVGVCFPRLLTAVAELESYAFYRENLGKPGITECAVRRRLGEFLDPPQDTWWTVSATTGHLPPVEDVTSPLTTAAIPWMESMSEVCALASARSERHALSNKVMDVAALFALGQKALAMDAAKQLAGARHPTQPELAQGLLRELVSLERFTSSHPGEA